MTVGIRNRATPIVRRVRRLIQSWAAPDGDEPSYVATLLKADYGIAANEVRRASDGEVSHSFIVRSSDDARWFVKIGVHDVCYGPPDRNVALMASRELSRYVDAVTIVEPQLTSDGRITVEGARGTLSVFPFVAGKILPLARWSHQTLRRAAKGIAQVHAATAVISSRPPRFDTEHMHFVSVLDAYDELNRVAPTGTATQRQILALLRRHWSDLAPMARRYLALRATVQATSNELVLSHTDLHGSNLLVSSSGGVAVVDWEGLACAPAEFDVYALLQPTRMRLVIDAYREVREQFDPREDVMAYLFLDDFVGRYPAFQLCRLIETADDAEKQETYGGRLRSLIDRGVGGRFEVRMRAGLAELQNAAAR